MTTDAHTVVAVVHPDQESLTHHVAARVGQAVARWGGVEVADLHREGFDPRFSIEDRRHYQAPSSGAPLEVRSEQARLDRATDLVLVFPVYWWSMPAMLKGWVDRVFINGWAFDIDEEGHVVPKLGRLRIHLVPVAGADRRTYERHGYETSMRTQILHGLVEYCGAALGATTFVHDSEDVSPEVREAEVGRAVDAITDVYANRIRPGTDAARAPR
jgi:NAD(P)H dehydrogenase (quinone)